MNKFYVYIHRRQSDGSVFYVGKGSGNRLHGVHARSVWWKSIVAKHGFSAEIIASNLPQVCSFSYERAIIAALGRARLCNLTNGGDGGIDSVPPHNTQKVYCSNGMEFPSGTAAAAWLKKHGFEKACQAGIGNHIRGKNHHAYGFTWSLTKEVPIFVDRFNRPNKQRKPVYCSNGMIFESDRHASDWVSEKKGKPVARSSITLATLGRYKMAYGYAWSRISFEDCKVVKSYAERDEKLSRKVVCIDTGETHASMQGAARWLRQNGWPVADATKISSSCAGKRPKAYGYRWQYV